MNFREIGLIRAAGVLLQAGPVGRLRVGCTGARVPAPLHLDRSPTQGLPGGVGGPRAGQVASGLAARPRATAVRVRRGGQGDSKLPRHYP